MLPITFISLCRTRPLGPAGCAVLDACTTVSTLAVLITLAISGLRMSARTNSARPMSVASSGDGAVASTPITRSIEGSSASRAARWPPRYPLTPVTRTTLGAIINP